MMVEINARIFVTSQHFLVLFVKRFRQYPFYEL